jgi:hypothetical protein
MAALEVEERRLDMIDQKQFEEETSEGEYLDNRKVMKVSENQMMNSSLGSSKGSDERMSESVMKESTTIDAKLKKLANAKKNRKQRTEHLCAYSMFLKEKKQAAGSKSLDMILVNQSWRSMTQIEKEPYIKLSKADKESLGPNYRLGRRKSTPKLKKKF